MRPEKFDNLSGFERETKGAGSPPRWEVFDLGPEWDAQASHAGV